MSFPYAIHIGRSRVGLSSSFEVSSKPRFTDNITSPPACQKNTIKVQSLKARHREVLNGPKMTGRPSDKKRRNDVAGKTFLLSGFHGRRSERACSVCTRPATTLYLLSCLWQPVSPLSTHGFGQAGYSLGGCRSRYLILAAGCRQDMRGYASRPYKAGWIRRWHN